MEEKPEATHSLKKNKIHIYLHPCWDFVALKIVYISRFRFHFFCSKTWWRQSSDTFWFVSAFVCTYCDTQSDITEGSGLLGCDSVALSFSRRFEDRHCLPSSRVKRYKKTLEDDGNTFEASVTTVERRRIASWETWNLSRTVFEYCIEESLLIIDRVPDWLIDWLTEWIHELINDWLNEWIN